MALLDRCIFLATSSGTGSFVEASAVAGFQTVENAGGVDGQTYSYAAQSSDLSKWEYGTGIWTASTKTLTRVVQGNSLGTTATINFTAPPQVMITALVTDFAVGGGAGISIRDTFAAIVPQTPAANTLAWATDLDQLMTFDGANWYIDSSYLSLQPTNNDIGSAQQSNRIGYGKDYVTDKNLVNCTIGYGSRPGAEGQIRYHPTTFSFQLYVNGSWKSLPYGVNMRLSSAFGFEIETASGLDDWLHYFGDSELLGLNGLPIQQGGSVSMGAYPPRQIMSGGTF